MPKPVGEEQKVNVEISQLEQQLKKKMNEDLVLEDEVFQDYGLINESDMSKSSDMLSIFQELQLKFLSAASDKPGIDILSETLKKLDRLNEQNIGKSTIARTEEELTSTSDSKPEALKKIVCAKSPAKLVNSNGTDLEPNDEVKQRPPIEKKVIDLAIERSDKVTDSCPLRTGSHSGDQQRDSQSPRRKEKKRDHSPKKDLSSSFKKKDSPQSNKRKGSLSKRGRSPSPRRRQSSPSLSRRRHNSISPTRRKRRSRSPLRKDESDRYCKRRRSRGRSRSQSPPRGFRRKSSSRSPHRVSRKRKDRSISPISLSPSPEKGLKDYKQPLLLERGRMMHPPKTIPSSNSSAAPPVVPHVASILVPSTLGAQSSNMSVVYPEGVSTTMYPDTVHAAPHHPSLQYNFPPKEDHEAKKRAVEMEIIQQKLTLLEQKKEYIGKQKILKSDLEKIEKQNRELIAEKKSNNEPIIQKNNKIQIGLQNKLKAVANAIDMLSDIIGDEEILTSSFNTQPLPERESIPQPTHIVKEEVICLDSPPFTGWQSQPPSENNLTPSGEKAVPGMPTSQVPQPPETQRSLSERSPATIPVLPRGEISLGGVLHTVENQPRNSTQKEESANISNLAPRPKSPELSKPIAHPPSPAVQPPPVTQPAEEVKTAESKAEEGGAKYNVIHFDPELHWCKVCNVFPRTAKEFLNHLHTPEHKKTLAEKKLVDLPWHNNEVEEKIPTYEDAPTKRVPIKGLQFFISATAWYCKLCDKWIGDLHCASVHLKSSLHSKNYKDFTDQNPHWEFVWLAKRSDAYEQSAKDRIRVEANIQLTNKQLNKEGSKSPLHLESQRSDSTKSIPKSDKSKLEKPDSEQVSSALKGGLEKTHSNHSKETTSNIEKDSMTSSFSCSTSSEKRKNVISSYKNQSSRFEIRNEEMENKNKCTSEMKTKNLKLKSKWDSREKEIDKNVLPDTNLNENEGSSSDDKLLKEWLEVSELHYDREILNQLSDSMKLKQQLDKSIEQFKELERKRKLQAERARYVEESRRKVSPDGRKRSDRYDKKRGSTERRDEKTVNKSERDYRLRNNSTKQNNSIVTPDKDNKRHHKSKHDSSKSKLENPRSKSKDILAKSPENKTCNENETKKDDVNIKDKTKTVKPNAETPCNGTCVQTKGTFYEGADSSDDDEANIFKSTVFQNKKNTVSSNDYDKKLPFIGKMPFISKFDSSKKAKDNLFDNDKKEYKTPDEISFEGKNKDKLLDRSKGMKDTSADSLICANLPKVTEEKSKNAGISKVDQNTSSFQRLDAHNKKSNSEINKKPSIQRSIVTLSTPTLSQRVAEAQQQRARERVSESTAETKHQQATEGPVHIVIDNGGKPLESLPENSVYPPPTSSSYSLPISHKQPANVSQVSGSQPSGLGLQDIPLPPLLVDPQTQFFRPLEPGKFNCENMGPGSIDKIPVSWSVDGTRLGMTPVQIKHGPDHGATVPGLIDYRQQIVQGTFNPLQISNPIQSPCQPFGLGPMDNRTMGLGPMVHQPIPMNDRAMGLGHMGHSPMCEPITMNNIAMDLGHMGYSRMEPGPGSIGPVRPQIMAPVPIQGLMQSPMENELLLPGSRGPLQGFLRPMGATLGEQAPNQLGPMELRPIVPRLMCPGQMSQDQMHPGQMPPSHLESMGPGPRPLTAAPGSRGLPPGPPPGFPVGLRPISSVDKDLKNKPLSQDELQEMEKRSKKIEEEVRREMENRKPLSQDELQEMEKFSKRKKEEDIRRKMENDNKARLEKKAKKREEFFAKIRILAEQRRLKREGKKEASDELAMLGIDKGDLAAQNIS